MLSRIFLLPLAVVVLMQTVPVLSFAQAGPPAASPDGSVVSEEIPDWRARLELGVLLGYAGRYPEAIDQYKQVLKDKPDSMEARAGLARVLYWTGRPKEAMAVMGKGSETKLSPEDRLLLADLSLSLKQYPDAERLFRAHLKDRPGDHAVRYKLAAMLSWIQRYDESLAEYETIMSARPRDAQLRRKYAEVLTWAGRHEEAIVQWQKTLGN
jgi:thioredoxin-like negative regulator of GroEL